MLTAQAATDLVLLHTVDFGVEAVALSEAVGRVLAEPLIADRDFPPFDRVTMDGIAIQFAAFEKGQRAFPIEGLQAAGTPRLTLHKIENCLEVMTGAMLPEATDTVIRYEDLLIENGIAKVQMDELMPGQNLHHQGSDRQQGTLIVSPNRSITPAEVGVAATIGKAQLQVKKLPRVCIISTGDELVNVTQQPLLHQIRSSNALVLEGLLKKWEIPVLKLHFIDNEELIVKELANCLTNFDMLLLSGGVSEGKLDYVPKALSKLGVKQLLHKVQQRPGKPFWFGKTDGGVTVFALPGNPVSAMLCAVRYLEPWLQKCLGLTAMPEKVAILAEEVVFKPNLTYFLQVHLNQDEQGKIWAHPVAGGGSGDLANLVEADAFLELPIGKDVYCKGEVFRLWTYRIFL